MKTAMLAQILCKDWGIENNMVYQTQKDYVDSLEDDICIRSHNTR